MSTLFHIEIVRNATRIGRRYSPFIVGIISLLLCAHNLLAADPSIEVKVKAGCILNFIKLTEWPGAAFASETSPLMFGLIGESALFPVLEQGLKDKLVNGRTVKIQRLDRAEVATNCHVLLAGGVNPTEAGNILSRIGKAPVLTVGESDDFARQGGIIGFIKTEGEVHFEVNSSAVERAGLKLSSQLLKVAVIVKEAPK